MDRCINGEKDLSQHLASIMNCAPSCPPAPILFFFFYFFLLFSFEQMADPSVFSLPTLSPTAPCFMDLNPTAAWPPQLTRKVIHAMIHTFSRKTIF